MNILAEARRITEAYVGRALPVSPRPVTLVDEFGDTGILQPPPYECQCMTKAQPWIDVACPLHGHLIRGLRNAVAARQREEGR